MIAVLAASRRWEGRMAKIPGSQGPSGSTGRQSEKGLKVRVKTSKGRKIGSTLWLQRQRKGLRVVDLGAAPGGWSQVAAKAVGSTDEHPLVVGIDYLEMAPLPGVILLQKDFTEDDAPNMLIEALGGHKVDLVLSDMASPTTGHRQTDHLRIVHLIEIAADYAVNVLAPGGAFVAKVFQGGTENELLAMLKRDFAQTFHAKPKASRQGSSENYLVAKGFRGKSSEEGNRE
jgi:23S rRNA (uridine2552-2'-O)-methyltransferase